MMEFWASTELLTTGLKTSVSLQKDKLTLHVNSQGEASFAQIQSGSKMGNFSADELRVSRGQDGRVGGIRLQDE